MIDSGMSPHNIREFAESVCGYRVSRVISTHSHFDHTAGNGFFDIIYGTEGTSRSAKNTMGGDPSKYPLDYEFTIIHDGDVLDIGGRPLEIIELDSHSPGNIAILDINNRCLFPGDEIDTGQVLLLPGYAETSAPAKLHAKSAASVETFMNAMMKLKGRQDAFDWILPAHNGAPVGKEWLDRFIELASLVLEGHEGSKDCSGRGYNAGMKHFPLESANYRRIERNGASLVYCADLIRDKDYKKGQNEPATELHRICAFGKM
jgi:glyoxylase-like metal-dependent hydrolase (beta-lactamase superfamily II)